ncbi:MAG: AsmA family protein [Rhodospirillaceae bacterium]|nr:AsmA family protein [Rhodospirillaceae bacterium]
MKKLLVSIIVLLVVIVAAALIAPGFIDWNQYKPEIAEAVSENTGRQLSIDGDISLRILPAPSLSVANVRLGNPKGAPGGASDGTFAKLESLQVHVALGPLLGGKIQVASVTLVKPEISLEVLPDGSGNWDFQATASGTDKPTTGGGDDGSGGIALQLDGARVVDGIVVFRDPGRGVEHRLDDIDLQIAASSLAGPFVVDGALSYGGERLGLKSALGAINQGRPSSLSSVITLGDGLARASFEGTLALQDGPQLRGQLALAGDEFPKAVAALGRALDQKFDLPEGLGQAFEIVTSVEVSAESAGLADLSIKLGDLRAKGSIAATLGAAPSVKASLDLGRINLDALGILTNESTAPTKSVNNAPGNANLGLAPLPGFKLPKELNGSLALTADVVTVKGGQIRQVRVETDLDQGRLRLAGLTAQLPGGSDVTLSGVLATPDGKPSFAGRADLVSDNLRAALVWLDVDVAGIAPDRMRKGALGADVKLAGEQFQLSNWTMDLDTTKLRGGLTLLMRERPAFGISLIVDKINVDAYLPPNQSASGQSAASTNAASAGSASPKDPPPSAALATALGSLSGFDANLRLDIGEALYRQTAIRGTSVDALVQDGALTIRKFDIADIGGGAFSVAGTLSGAGSAPTGDLEISLKAKSATRLARLAGIETNDTLQRIGRFELRGKLTGGLESLKIKGNLKALGSSLDLIGAVKPLTVPPIFDATIAAKHPAAEKLFAIFAPGVLAPGAKLGQSTLNASLNSDNGSAISLDVALDLASVHLTAKGSYGAGSDDPALDLTLDAAHPDLVGLARVMAPKFNPAKRDLGPLKVTARVGGTARAVQISNLELITGPIKLKGKGGLDLGDGRPKLNLVLGTGRIEVDPWLPAGAPSPKVAAPAVPVKSARREWSRDRIDTSGLMAADADITLDAEQVVYGAYVIDNAKLGAILKDGVLTLNKFAGGMFGGSIVASGKLAHGSVPSVGLNLEIKQADIRKAALAASGVAKVDGVLDYQTDMSSRGASEHALVSALSGTGSILVRDGVIEGLDLPIVSKQLDKLNRPVDFLTLVEKAMKGGTTPFKSLTASYQIKKGVLRSEDITLESPAAAGRGTAVVNLPPQEMDTRIKFWLVEYENSPPIGVRFIGPLDNPRMVLDIEKLQAYVLQRVVERGILRQFEKKSKPQTGDNGTTQTAPAAAPTAPVEQKKLTPEDALKGILKGLLKQ